MSLHRWGEPSFSPPYTAGGLSSLVSAPPWHYAGWLMNISFAYDAVGAVDVWWLSFVRFGHRVVAAFWARNEARGIVILCEQRVTKPKAPPNEPSGQRLAALSAALVLVCVE